jgi:NAD-dependent SIR2 family protein deacetylase
MTFNQTIEDFIKKFLLEMDQENAVIFAGAGLSAASGHVDWKKLLEEFAKIVGLEVKKETDLISIAQYYVNQNPNNNRYPLSKAILNEFHHGKLPNPNHEILARLPISIYWTTNYDRLIEKSLEKADKIVDVKYKTEHLKQTVVDRDVVLYKMHGDVIDAHDTIITKDEYEAYFATHGPFVNALSGDLVSKTFLFIGFSFTDPNLDYIFSRIRVTFKGGLRPHYCFFREVKRESYDSDDDFEYAKNKLNLVIGDLGRFNINILVVKEYEEITEILAEIENRFKRRTIFISGSAHEYTPWDSKDAESFISKLSKALIKNGLKIVSGFGLGVGSFVINGVLEEVYVDKNEKLKDQLLLRPFPQGQRGQEQWQAYREDMVSYAGIAIFIFGNKLKEGNIVLADGIRKEFEISINQGVIPIPIGATGYMTKEIFDEIFQAPKDYYKGVEELIPSIEELGAKDLSPDDIVDKVVKIVKKLQE